MSKTITYRGIEIHLHTKPYKGKHKANAIVTWLATIDGAEYGNSLYTVDSETAKDVMLRNAKETISVLLEAEDD